MKAVKIRRLRPVIDHEFVMRSLTIISGSQGRVVSMPKHEERDGSFQDRAHSITTQRSPEKDCGSGTCAFEKERNESAQTPFRLR